MVKNLFIVVLATVIVLSACKSGNQAGGTGDSVTVETANMSDEAEKVIPISPEEKKLNLLKNFTAVFTGSMVLSFSKEFKGMVSSLAKVAGDSAQNKIDENFGQIPETLKSKIDSMVMMIGMAYDTMKILKPALYDKITHHAVMDRGVAIVDSASIPSKFKPITGNLNGEDIMLYVNHISFVSSVNPGKEINDPVVKMYQDLFKWTQEFEVAFKDDPDYADFKKSKRGK